MAWTVENEPARKAMVPSWIKYVAAAKLLVVLVAVAMHFGQVRFGELDLRAAESEPPAAAQAGDAKTVDPARQEAGRKSFLDDLLELPSLDREKLKKEDVARYLSMADRKKKQIDERILVLGQREKKLLGLEKVLDDKLKKLEDERKFFAQSIQQEKDLQGQRLDKLVELYDKMEPKKAAPVFEKMDEDLVIALFKRLRQKQVTLILETMSAERSVKLSEYFGRIRSGKEYDLLKEMNSSLRQEFADCKGMPKEPATLGAAAPAAAPAAAQSGTAAAKPATPPAQ
jgi:flagellar motility protein MotE (MotC chaperone)